MQTDMYTWCITKLGTGFKACRVTRCNLALDSSSFETGSGDYHTRECLTVKNSKINILVLKKKESNKKITEGLPGISICVLL